MANTFIQIKRSGTTAAPSTLKTGELAYSYVSNTLFMGTADGLGVIKLGGQAFMDQTNAASSYANSAFQAANSAGSYANSAYAAANNVAPQVAPAFAQANAAFQAANSAGSYANSAYLQANTGTQYGQSAGSYANSAYSQANTAFNNAAAASSYANSAYLQSNAHNTFANSAAGFYNKTGGAINGDVSITGNLVITGTTTFVNTATVSTNDSLIKLASNNTVGDIVDIGFYGQSNTGAAVVYHGLVREGSGDPSAGNFFLFKNLTSDPGSSNVINYSAATRGTLVANLTGGIVSGLTQAIAVADGGTGTTTSTGTGSVVLSNSPTFGGTANFTNINTATISVGTTTYVANNILGSFAGNANTYEQFVIQNANTGTQASVDFIVSNDQGQDNGFYGDFGMNSSGFSGPGVLDKAGAVYLYSDTAELVIGTHTANGIHFVVNNGTTDAATISSNGVLTLATALPIASGGTGTTTATGSGSVVLQSSPTLTTPILGVASGTSLNVTNGLVSTSSYSGTFNDGIVVDYAAGLGRISVGGSDGIQFYANTDTTRTALLSIAANTALSNAIWMGSTVTVPFGGTGATSFSAGQILLGNGTGALQPLPNSTFTATGTGAQNNTVTSVTVDAYGRFTALKYDPISGLTVGQGGTGLSSITTNGITYGNGTGAVGVTAAAGTSDQTFSNQVLTTTNAGVPVWTTTLDGGSF